MSQNKRIPKGKEINPTFFVFCEGETEEAYIGYLRTKYRLPILIDAKIAGNRITNKYIHNYKKNKPNHPKDKTFLVYDLDVPEILERLKAIKNTVLLCSNPCFELWYLLHTQEQKAEITSAVCLQKLKKHLPNYSKGFFNNELKNKIEERQAKAVSRAAKLTEFKNPSSQLFVFIIEIEKVKKQKIRHDLGIFGR
jgi:hypothetical protein